MGVIINKAVNDKMHEVYEFTKEADMDVLGSIPVDENLLNGSVDRKSTIVYEAIKHLYPRLNLPQENNR